MSQKGSRFQTAHRTVRYSSEGNAPKKIHFAVWIFPSGNRHCRMHVRPNDSQIMIVFQENLWHRFTNGYGSAPIGTRANVGGLTVGRLLIPPNNEIPTDIDDLMELIGDDLLRILQKAGHEIIEEVD